MSKFTVYSHTRATRQEAGDIAEKLIKNHAPQVEIDAWRKIESDLNDVECKLERLDLKE